MFNIDNINSFREAKLFWVDEFGDPDYLHREDLTDIENVLNEFDVELKRLKKEIESHEVNNYKLNRVITLHFVVDVGNQYLEEAHQLCYEEDLEKEFEKIDNFSDENSYWED